MKDLISFDAKLYTTFLYYNFILPHHQLLRICIKVRQNCKELYLIHLYYYNFILCFGYTWWIKACIYSNSLRITFGLQKYSSGGQDILKQVSRTLKGGQTWDLSSHLPKNKYNVSYSFIGIDVHIISPILFTIYQLNNKDYFFRDSAV